MNRYTIARRNPQTGGHEFHSDMAEWGELQRASVCLGAVEARAVAREVGGTALKLSNRASRQLFLTQTLDDVGVSP